MSRELSSRAENDNCIWSAHVETLRITCVNGRRRWEGGTVGGDGGGGWCGGGTGRGTGWGGRRG